MIRRAMVMVLAFGALASAARAQAPARFRWQTGQVLVYRTEHATQATDVMGDTRIEDKTRVLTTKRWQVLSVDSDGVATVQLSLSALRYEKTTPGGEVLAFDSADPDKSRPEVRQQFARYLGKPLAVIRIDGRGKVVEVKEAQPGFGSVAKFDNQPPFLGLLPAEGPAAGQTWERVYQITLEPPQGTGEKYDAVQRYVCKGIADNLATVALTTEVKQTAKVLDEQVPLWQMQPEGEIVFDLKAGRLHRAVLKIDKEGKGLQGEGSSTHFQSTYVEQYAGDK
jgi:hypothetical protein